MTDTQGYGLDELEVGQSAQIERLVDETTVQKFAEVSGDYNPLHMDEEYASKSAFRGRIAHGALVASFVSCVLGSHLPGHGAVFRGMSMQFSKPARIGDTVISRATVKEIEVSKRRVILDCVCMVGDEIVMEAEAEVMVRKRRKKTAVSAD